MSFIYYAFPRVPVNIPFDAKIDSFAATEEIPWGSLLGFMIWLPLLLVTSSGINNTLKSKYAYISCPSSTVSLSSKNVWLLLVNKVLRDHNLGVRSDNCWWVIMVSRHFQLTKQEYVYLLIGSWMIQTFPSIQHWRKVFKILNLHLLYQRSHFLMPVIQSFALPNRMYLCKTTIPISLLIKRKPIVWGKEERSVLSFKEAAKGLMYSDWGKTS